MPSFLAGGELRVIEVRAKGEHAASLDQVGGNDVPNVLGNDVGGDKIEDVPNIGAVSTAHGAGITVAILVGGRFHLHASELATVPDDEVETCHLSPGFINLQAMFGGSGHETHLGPLAAQFAVTDLHSSIFH